MYSDSLERSWRYKINGGVIVFVPGVSGNLDRDHIFGGCVTFGASCLSGTG